DTVTLRPDSGERVRVRGEGCLATQGAFVMTEPDDLIPVRALNQVSYCPRLYYLEYVESVMPINEHVEDGLFQHRRVDDPELQNRLRKENGALHTRSVQISSARLGISGKLDLVEERDGLVYPVEY